MEILLILICVLLLVYLAYQEGKNRGFNKGVASVPPPDPCYHETEAQEVERVIFGRYCLLAHAPNHAEPYAVYPYNRIHEPQASEFYFTHFEDAFTYLRIFDENAEEAQRRNNLLNNLDADFGLPPKIDWDLILNNLDCEDCWNEETLG